MPRPSKIDQLPKKVRLGLDARLSKTGSSHYEEHRAWLANKGHAVSIKSLWGYAQRRLKGEIVTKWCSHRPDPVSMKDEELFRERAILAPAARRAEAIKREIDRRFSTDGQPGEAAP
jgi:hypothetical protein